VESFFEGSSGKVEDCGLETGAKRRSELDSNACM
jgi:hypothetical protein